MPPMRNAPSKKAFLQACGSLQDFLNPQQRSIDLLPIAFEMNPSAKDLLEAQGIPHTAIFHLFINGRTKPLYEKVRDQDTLVAYPQDFVSTGELEAVYYQPSAFLTDIHLGKLAKSLRLLGIDTSLARDLEDQQIIHRSNRQKYMILTRDLNLLKHSDTRYGYWVRSTDPDEQLHEIFRRFDLASKMAPFSRCMECNGLLHEVPLQKVRQKIPPKVQEWHKTFYQCERCSRVYWRGSHYQKLQQKVDTFIRKYT